MSNLISSPSLIATFLFPACWERPHGNCELFILDTSSLIFTAQSMKSCSDKFMEKTAEQDRVCGEMWALLWDHQLSPAQQWLGEGTE